MGEGANEKEVTAWAITGVSNSPIPVWADANGKFFGFVFFLSWLPEQYAAEHARLNEAQTKAMARAGAGAGEGAGEDAGGRRGVHERAACSTPTRRCSSPDQTVVVDKGQIAAVGPSKSVKVPAGAQVIDGRGKTLLPGLWDCHMHVGDDFTGLQELSMGVTSMRDPGNDDSLTIDRRARARKGELLMPHVYPSSLIDGKGTYTAQVANVATSEAEAIALVDKAKAKASPA